MVRVEIFGIREVQAAIERIMMAFRPGSRLSAAIHQLILDLHQYSTAITHVDTGTLRLGESALMIGSERGMLFIHPAAINPVTNTRASEYAIEEHDRGGDHAFFERTYEERGPAAANRAMEYIIRGLP